MNTLCEILAKYPTDKNTVHSYGPVYEELFKPYREKCVYLLEIGVKDGASLRAWREYFPHATIHGVDINPFCRINEERILSFTCDSTKFAPYTEYDIIIDDGCHELGTQLATLLQLWPSVSIGGLYIIEDITRVGQLFRYFPNSQLHIGKKQKDDNLFIMRKQ